MKSKYILLVVYISIWMTLYLLPRGALHVGGKDGIEPWIIFATTFFVLPYILFKLLNSYKIKHDRAIAFAGASVFLIAPFILLVNYEDKNELINYREYQEAIITNAQMIRHKRKPPVWTVQATYWIDSIKYKTSFKEDRYKTIMKGDTITIIYSSKTPQMSEIKELIDYYGQ